MTDHNAITPPSELLQQLLELCGTHVEPSWHWKTVDKAKALLVEACQYGADQELEACIQWLVKTGYWGEDGKAIHYLRAARRPKPPSLKEKALARLAELESDEPGYWAGIADIRRALEQLDD